MSFTYFLLIERRLEIWSEKHVQNLEQNVINYVLGIIHYIAKMQSEQIRKNRERIRKNMKACFVIPSKNTKIPQNTIDIKKLEQDHTRGRLRRKTSEDIRIFDDVNYLKEIYISNSFSDLFELGEKLGEGAQSTVYSCKQLATGITYAVKFIRNKEAELTRTLKEQYRILKTIDHQNIIKAHYLFINEIEASSHMVCDYCPMPPLGDYLKGRTLKEIEAAEIITYLLNALYEMHKRQICHRDIKPDNILYDHVSGELKIIDFEIAKMSKYDHERVQMMTPTGTLFYKAPEMFGGAYTQAIDMWAVGVIAYEMIFGHLPFQSEYSLDTATKIRDEEPSFDSVTITPTCANFIRMLLNKNPLQRLSASQALKTPFILKYSSISTSSSPRLKHNGSEQDRKEDRSKDFGFDLTRCYNEDSQINGKNSFSEDIGIRLCTKSLRDCQFNS